MTFRPIGLVSTQRQHKIKENNSHPGREEKELRELQLSGEIPTGIYQYSIYKRMGYDVSKVKIFEPDIGGQNTKDNYESSRAPVLLYGDLVSRDSDGNRTV